MYFSDETQREYDLLKKQREVLVSWDKFREKFEENQKRTIKEIDDEEEALMGNLKHYVEENKPKLKRPSFRTYCKKNICLLFTLVVFYVGYFLFASKDVYIYHGISLAGSIAIIILAMGLYRYDLIKSKDKGRIYKPIIDYLFMIIFSVPIAFIVWKLLKLENAQILPLFALFPILFDIIYVVFGVYSWNSKMDKCTLYDKETTQKLKDLEEKKENAILEGQLEYNNKSRDYFKEEEVEIYLPSFTNGDDVEKLLLYFEQGRAETIKEAVTIFFEEKRFENLNEKLNMIMQKVDDMAITEQEVHNEMKNMRLSTINQLGGVQEAIVGTIKRDRTAKMTATQKKNYEKKLEKSAKQDEKQESKKAAKVQRKLDKEAEIAKRKQEQAEREAEREAMLLAKREEKIQKGFEKKKENVSNEENNINE